MLDFNQIKELIAKGETVSLECKEASFAIPKSVYETYSSLANTNGGHILLGVKEDRKNHSFEVTGVVNADEMLKSFWGEINNPRKVSINILKDENVYTVTEEGKTVIVIKVPRARFNERPVYVGENPYSGTFKRNNEGDYHCTMDEVNSMIRDKSSNGNDSVILEGLTMNDIDNDTLRGYRNFFRTYNDSHIWNGLPDQEFLENLGGYARDEKTGVEGLTAAGFLMFGKGVRIRNKFAHIFMDYRDERNKTVDVRWIDRIVYDGTWECNLFNFFMRVVPKLTADLQKPFHLEGIYRVDDTPVHKAVREALINMIIHADYFIQGTLKVIRNNDSFVISNPGSLKLPREQIYKGGSSLARNPNMQTMFRMIGLGDEAGSGFPTIVSVWKENGWIEPDLEEEYELNQVVLTLSFKKPAIKNGDKKVAIKTVENKKAILSFLSDGSFRNINEIMEVLGLGKSRTRELLAELTETGEIIAEGSNKYRKYRRSDY